MMNPTQSPARNNIEPSFSLCQTPHPSVGAPESKAPGSDHTTYRLGFSHLTAGNVHEFEKSCIQLLYSEPNFNTEKIHHKMLESVGQGRHAHSPGKCTRAGRIMSFSQIDLMLRRK